MSPEPRVYRNRVSESGTKYHRSRLTDRDNNVLTQMNFSGTIRHVVYDLSAADVDLPIYSNAALTISALVFNTLQSWEEDSIGYNFQGSTTSNNVAWEGGHTYRICFYLNHTTEGKKAVVFENTVAELFGV